MNAKEWTVTTIMTDLTEAERARNEAIEAASWHTRQGLVWVLSAVMCMCIVASVTLSQPSRSVITGFAFAALGYWTAVALLRAKQIIEADDRLHQARMAEYLHTLSEAKRLHNEVRDVFTEYERERDDDQ